MYESLKKALGCIARCYVTPLSFEERLYELLGIRTFKKYMPTTGDLMLRYVWKWKMLRDYDSETLSRQVSFTLTAEIVHLVFFVIYLPFCFMEPVWVGITMNLLVNVYPVMLQRHTRARIYRLLKMRAGRRGGSSGNLRYELNNAG